MELEVQEYLFKILIEPWVNNFKGQKGKHVHTQNQTSTHYRYNSINHEHFTHRYSVYI